MASAATIVVINQLKQHTLIQYWIIAGPITILQRNHNILLPYNISDKNEDMFFCLMFSIRPDAASGLNGFVTDSVHAIVGWLWCAYEQDLAV